MKVRGQTHSLWRAVDHEGGVLESYVAKTRYKASALKFVKKAMKRYGNPHVVVTDKCPSYRAAMKMIGSEDRQESGGHLDNRVENSHLLFRRRERAMSRCRRMRSLQKFVSVHSSVCNHFNGRDVSRPGRRVNARLLSRKAHLATRHSPLGAPLGEILSELGYSNDETDNAKAVKIVA